ncbi:hypothetical protein [Terriglobus sp. TAA 43]|uniref:hypothetical protein n=1 Tax=Terriglobus sp. TAA 43 TaxID=278961 RepID=UPI0006476B4E|nr:hypothetical protein [Terriglobus sp. TAA 43]
MKALVFSFIIVVLANSGFGQSANPDTQAQQQILEELRAIHRDTKAGSTLQLLLAELQIAQASLERANQGRESLKAQLAQSRVDNAAALAEVSRFEWA